MSDSSSICLSCGVCCDGTLIGFVQLEKEELPALREIMDIEEGNYQGFFLQPCIKFCGGCSIYTERPKQCAAFECGLLKSVNQKELSFDSAIDIVQIVKQKRIEIEKKMLTFPYKLQSDSFYFKMVELKKVLQKHEKSLKECHLALVSDLDQLDRILSNNFGVSLS